MGTYEVSVKCRFTASHAVCLPDGGMETPHEHDWNVTATFRSQKLDPVMGVVIDFLAVQEALAAITSDLEGTDLNALLANSSATGVSAERVAEFLARALMRRLGEGTSLYRLAVSEAPGCWAAWYPQSP
jgi:6-pyruvoyl-tetrahydropterin synthase